LRGLESLVSTNQLFALSARFEQDGPTILTRGFSTDEPQILELVQTLAARGGRNAETPRKLTYLEVGVGGDQLEETELGSRKPVAADSLQEILFEELAQQRSEDVSGAQESVKIITGSLLISEAPP